ncbi:MAG: GGDEF domain-containing protein [gamma proteobacterium symbiont of Lucinoma myriamae]|nr:GGDEF domain-containing protein [gamma proteobacterium symbiont of Lucinoma myriamae]
MFVFAGRSGQQDAVFNRMEVVEMLDNGQLAQTKDYDLPLLERSLYAIMGGVHDDIAKQSNVDKLTGLIKQKEFIRLFNERLKKKNGLAYDCSLCLIDIDQFSLINDTCGYEAGNQYIAEISQLLVKNLNSDVIVGRYGIDEFILFLPECSTEKSLEISALQRKLINGYNFKWEDKEFTLSASIGMVAVSEANEAGVFLKAVVTATTIAKEMGRNRVHFLEYDALELNHRQELQLWATRVDQMLKNDQLNIRCQRLHPPLFNTMRCYYWLMIITGLIWRQVNLSKPQSFIIK